MGTVRETIIEATRLWEAGQLPQVEALCRQVLRAEPNQAEAIHLLGLLAGQASQPELSIELLHRAVALQPGIGTFHHNLGCAYSSHGDLTRALIHFREALRLQPKNVDFLNA